VTDPRRVVVVGAASGIGAATATHFHECGDQVLAVDRRRHNTPASDFADCDLSRPSEIRALLTQIGPDWDILAHIAGVPGTAPAVDVLTINYLGTRLMVEGMLPLMRRGGAIVTVGSTAGLGWQQRQDELAGLLAARDAESVELWCADQDPAMSYYTSKQAVIMFTKRVAAQAWSRYGVRVNVVSPGPVETPILADFEATIGREALDAARTFVGRHATVDDVVPVIDFLTSAPAGWIMNTQIISCAQRRRVVVAGQCWPGNRNDIIVARHTVVQLLDGRVVLGDSGYRGITSITTPRRDQTGRIFHDDQYRVHRRIRARVEHVIARLKDWQILRQCRRRGDAINHNLQVIAGLWNLKTRNQLGVNS
jgi:NAD(P)-dependent dehydrogenase (short-subunit alcohol dehydrogenase family)